MKIENMSQNDTEPFAIDYHNMCLSDFNTGKVPKNKIVFAGDSTVDFGQWKDLLKNMTTNPPLRQYPNHKR